MIGIGPNERQCSGSVISWCCRAREPRGAGEGEQGRSWRQGVEGERSGGEAHKQQSSPASKPLSASFGSKGPAMTVMS